MPAPIRPVDELGFPVPGSFDDLTGQPPRPTRSWRQFFYKYRWGVLLLLLPLLFGSSLITAARQLVAQRLLHSAVMRFYRDQMPEALTSANQALFWEPDAFDCWEVYMRRAEIREEMQDLKGSLDDLDQVIKRLEDPARSKQFSGKLCDAYAMRAGIRERLGRPREAIADATTALNLAPDADARARSLNQRAYIRALAGTELEQALQDVEQSLGSIRTDPDIIDTRGYILFRLGKYPAALKDMQLAINRKTEPLRDLRFQGDIGPREMLAASGIQSLQLRKYREALAVMYHHRGEIFKKLGQETKGDDDIRRAEKLGYDRERGVY
jgi:tetratricopeptide (TPR) repeat protein